MLNVLGHGETGGIGELMALNLYLNNIFGTVLIHKIPVEPIVSLEDFQIAKKHSRGVHIMIMEKLYDFWNTWCSDKDVVTQYRLKYANKQFEVILDEISRNIKVTNKFIHRLNVSGNVGNMDFDPNKILLTNYVNGLISNKSMPEAILNDIQLKFFEASFEFNPKALYINYHKSVFKSIYTIFYWTTITHLKLGVQFIDNIERFKVETHGIHFMMKFVKFVRPLTVFDINQYEFITRLPPKASMNIGKLIIFLLRLYYDIKPTNLKNAILLSARPEIQNFVNLLNIDMKIVLNMEVPDYYFNNLNYDAALELMQTNYQAFTRLVSATSGSKEDRRNINKIQNFFYFLSESMHFKEN